MKKIVKFINILLAFLLFGGVGYGGYRSYNTLFRPTTCSIDCDNHLSEEISHQLSRFIDKLSYPTVYFAQLAYSLKKEFPLIKEVSIAHVPANRLNIALESYKPLLIINNDIVLFETGILASKESVEQEKIDHLGKITIHESAVNGDQLCMPCYECISTLPSQLFEMYNINWNNPHELILQDKCQPRFAIVCDTKTIFDEEKICICSTLKNKLEQQPEFTRNKTKKWLADIRFDNQVIIFSRGGRGHGYNTIT